MEVEPMSGRLEKLYAGGTGGGGNVVFGKSPSTVSSDVYEALECADRIHNLIDSISDRIFPSLRPASTAEGAPDTRIKQSIAEMATEARQRLENAESRLRSILERL